MAPIEFNSLEIFHSQTPTSAMQLPSSDQYSLATCERIKAANMQSKLLFKEERRPLDRPSSIVAMDQPDGGGDMSYVDGRTRSYDCVFCKRGFTNAQALGGHMNIHRRHRAQRRDANVGLGDHSNTLLPSLDTRDYRGEEDFLHRSSSSSGYANNYYNYGGPSASASFNEHHHLRSFLPSYNYKSSYGSSSSKKEKKRHGKDVVEPEKMQELIRYGKDLELGFNLKKRTVDKEDDDDELNLDLTL